MVRLIRDEIAARDRRADDEMDLREVSVGRAAPFRPFRAVSIGLVIVDIVALGIAYLVARFLATGSAWVSAEARPAIPIGVVAWVIVFHLFGLYAVDRLAARDQTRNVVGATAAGVTVLSLFGVWEPGRPAPAALASMLVVAVVLELLGRKGIGSAMARLERGGRLASRTLIVGSNEEAHRLAHRLAGRAGRFIPVAYVASTGGLGASPDGLPVVGAVGDLEHVIGAYDIGSVFVASSAVSDEEIASVHRACRRADTDLRISANVADLFASRLSVRSEDGLTSFAVRPVRLTGPQAVVKRLFDLVVSSLLLVLVSPLLVVIATAIRLTSPGPAFFRQARVTKDGRVFQMVKFRTMVVDPARALEGQVIDLTQPFFKLENDPRLTRIGRLLRSLSVDELPQLWNVLRGDMSLVGPRPLPVEQVEANREFLASRHEVRGGITGLWQISGRSELDSEEALRIDRRYIENWSLGLDVRIMLRTIGAVLARRGAV
jgi:exopolysaccharide biosynthesis polyprenyl glycosylphosphotransferase